MSVNIKINTGENANVKNEVIDFRPLNTKSREDDKAWNSMELYGETDGEESEYRGSDVNIDQKTMEKIRQKTKRMFGRRVLELVGEAA